MKFNCAEIIVALKKAIETVIGKDYRDFTNAIKDACGYTDLCRNAYQLSISNNTTIEHVTVYIDWVSVAQFSNSSFKTFKGIDCTKLTSGVRYLLTGNSNLKTIYEPLDFSAQTSSWFLQDALTKLPNLVNVRLVPETLKYTFSISASPLLSDESIQSIIEGLATVETTQTLMLHSTVVAKLTTEQLLQITNKNWSV
jgi:hypothetical protein